MLTLWLLLAGLDAPAATSQRDVTIQSFDAVSLSATYYDPGKPGSGVVIFRNCDRDRRSVDSTARHLSARGTHVLTWDYRSGLTVFDWLDARLSAHR